MSVVKSELVYLRILGKQWRKQIRFHKDHFLISMPEDFAVAFQNENTVASGKSIEEVNKDFNRLIKKWEQAKVATRKVLAYCFGFNYDEKTKNDRYKCVFNQLEWRGWGQDTPDVGVGFSFEVCQERVVGQEKFYFNLSKNPFWKPEDKDNPIRQEFDERKASLAGCSFSDDRTGLKVHIIDWTQEREDFFKNLDLGIRSMLKRVIDFEKSLKKVGGLDLAITQRSGQMLLPPAPEVKK